MTTRRDFLGRSALLGVGLGLAGCAGRRGFRVAAIPQSAVGAGSLKAHATERGLLYGCAVDVGLLKRDASYARMVRQQAAIVVAENAMKWEGLRPTSTTFDFTEADELVSFAEANGMKMRGHTLCWHRQMPAWFGAEATASNARDLLTVHIERVAGRYAGRMHSWDVVNEAVEAADGRADGLRDSPWLRLVGPDYVEEAFRAARNADPQALLTYNEFGLETEDAAAEKKRAAVLLLLRRLKARHVPLDALGVQSHLTARGSYGTGLTEFLSAVRGLGMQIFLTEMDVNDRDLPAEIVERDTAVAESYRSYLGLVLREPAVRVVMTWGITDRRTWLNGEGGRADGLPERPLPFGSENGLEDAPKRAFFAIRKAIDGRSPGFSAGRTPA